ncbi:MAG TPA: stage II sporulation protein M [Firmicutes bacterium]|nr:stage II sporulation protein M [Bacillota bacterium]
MMRQGRRTVSAARHLQENYLIYVAVFVALTAGIAAGALSVRQLSEDQVSELNRVFFSFVDYLSGEHALNHTVILQRSLLQNGLLVLLFWLCGLFFFGFLFSLGLVFYRGFCLGFTVGFLAGQNALQGMVFATAAVLPQNLLYVPAIVLAGVLSTAVSLRLLRRRLRRQPAPAGNDLLQYTLVVLLLAVFFAAGSLVETMVTPVLMRAVVTVF